MATGKQTKAAPAKPARPAPSKGGDAGGGRLRGGYVMVKDRIAKFWETYPDGRILSNPVPELSSIDHGWVTFRAELYRDEKDSVPFAVGYAHERTDDARSYVNSQGWIFENGQTSAIGRAIGIAGILAEGGIPTQEDMERARQREEARGRDDRRDDTRQPGTNIIDGIHFPADVEAKDVTEAAKPETLDFIRAEAQAYNLDADGVSVQLLRCHLSSLNRDAANALLAWFKRNGKTFATGQGATASADAGAPAGVESIDSRRKAPATVEPMSDKQEAAARALASAKNLDVELEAMAQHHKDFKDLTGPEAATFIDYLRNAAQTVEGVAARVTIVQTGGTAKPTAAPAQPTPEDLAELIYQELTGLKQAGRFKDATAALDFIAEFGKTQKLQDWPPKLTGISKIPEAARKVVLDHLREARRQHDSAATATGTK